MIVRNGELGKWWWWWWEQKMVWCWVGKSCLFEESNAIRSSTKPRRELLATNMLQVYSCSFDLTFLTTLTLPRLLHVFFEWQTNPSTTLTCQLLIHSTGQLGSIHSYPILRLLFLQTFKRKISKHFERIIITLNGAISPCLPLYTWLFKTISTNLQGEILAWYFVSKVKS